MKNNETIEENLVSMIAKIGEKITLGRSKTICHDNSTNYSYLEIEYKKADHDTSKSDLDPGHI